MNESRPTPDVGFDATITPIQTANHKITTDAEPVQVVQQADQDDEDNEAGAMP